MTKNGQSGRSTADLSLKKREEKLGKRDVFEIPGIKQNPLSVVLIKKFTKDERLNIQEMLKSLHKFVNSERIDEKLGFVFEIYDLDNDGIISTRDLFEIIKLLNKGLLDDWKIQNIVDKTFANLGEYKSGMNYEEFKDLIFKRSKNLGELLGCTS